MKSPFRGAWREGIGQVLAAVVLALAVAVVVDLANGRQQEPSKHAARAAARKTQAAKRETGPRHVVAVRRSGAAVVVRDLLTGHDVGVSVSAPQGRRFHQVAAAGNGSYIVSGYAAGRVTFNRLVLDSAGRPQDLAPIAGLELRGVSTTRSDLAVSADGGRIAYVTYRGGKGRVDVVTVGTRQRRGWTTRSSGTISSLSWAGDTLSFVWSPAAGKGRQVRTLNTTGAGGDLRVSRVVLRLPAGSASAVLSGDGSTIAAGVRDRSEVSVEVFSATTGRRTEVLWASKADGSGELTRLARDSGGGQLLATGTEGRLFVGSPRGVHELPAADLGDLAW